MDSRKLKIGDRVVALENNIGVPIYDNQMGTIVDILNWHSDYCFRVKYDLNGSRIWSKVRPLTLLEKALYEED